MLPHYAAHQLLSAFPMPGLSTPALGCRRCSRTGGTRFRLRTITTTTTIVAANAPARPSSLLREEEGVFDSPRGSHSGVLTSAAVQRGHEDCCTALSPSEDDIRHDSIADHEHLFGAHARPERLLESPGLACGFAEGVPKHAQAEALLSLEHPVRRGR